MSDLISRQDAIDAADRADYTGLAVEDVKIVTDKVVKELKQLPSVQPEIISCKDCKWSDWYTVGDGSRYCYCMETDNGGRTENDYCSYAERQEE